MKEHLTKLHKPVHVLNRSEKWSEYYTCKECEDEVNRKGHLTNLKKEFMWKIFKMIFVYGINLFNKKFGRFLAKCWGGHFDHHPEMNERVA